MPEGHTIHRLATRHRELFAGSPVAVSSPQGRFAAGAALIDGRMLQDTEAYGKHLLHHYEGERDLLPSNTSFDWAGGGLVTTAADLIRFLNGLFSGRLFGEAWLAQMLSFRERVRFRPFSSARYLTYGLGLGSNRAWGESLVGATGVWGAFAYRWPARQISIAGTVNLFKADRAALMDEVVRALS